MTDLEHARSGYEGTVKMVEANEKLIEHVTKQNRELRELALFEARQVAKAGEAVRPIKQAPGG